MSEPYWIVEHPDPWDAQGVSEDEWCAENCRPEPTCADLGHPVAAEDELGVQYCHCDVAQQP